MNRFLRHPALSFFSLAAIFLFFSGCEDPSSVGLDLVDDGGGTAMVNEIVLDTVTSIDARGIRDNANQTLAGQVNDPLLGEVASRGFIDFLYNSVQSTAYREGTVERIIFRINLTYVYGDTLEPVTFALHDVLEEFSGIATSPDSIPGIGPEITQFTFNPSDTLVLVEMPAEWVASQDQNFRDNAAFADVFNGLHIAPVSGNAVVGLANRSNSQTAMISIVDSDSVSFSATKGISVYDRISEPNLPEDRLLIQSGIGPNIRLDLDLEAFKDNGLNRAVIRLESDTLGFNDTPGFVRPVARDMVLWGVFPDSAEQVLGNAPLSDEGLLDFNSATMQDIFQAIILSEDPFSHYEIRPVTDENTIDALVLFGPQNQEASPRMFLTLTPFD